MTKQVRDARKVNAPLQAKLDKAQADVQQVDVKMKEIVSIQLVVFPFLYPPIEVREGTMKWAPYKCVGVCVWMCG